jgi:glutathione S-transferase
MKLYYAPGACSLASRISLYEAGLAADFERVDLKTKRTERGEDYLAINPRGSVPMLVLNDGQAITENVAILALITDLEPAFEPGNPLGRIRLIEMLSYLSSELHIAFKPFWHDATGAEKDLAAANVTRLVGFIADDVNELYLFGPRFTVADAYLFVMLRWAISFGIAVPLSLRGYFERVIERPTVRAALAEEGLDRPLEPARPPLAVA